MPYCAATKISGDKKQNIVMSSAPFISSGLTAVRLLCLLLCMTVVHGCAMKGLIEGKEQNLVAEPVNPKPPSGGDFTLHSKDGLVSLHDFNGKVVLLFFGYVNCPDVCPTSLALNTKALNSLSEDELAQVQPLFITVDPQRDSVEDMAEFVSFFHPGFIGLTGSESEISRVIGLYGVKHYRMELQGFSSDYAINHSAAVYLITRKGTLRFLFPHGTSPTLVVKAIRYLLAQ